MVTKSKKPEPFEPEKRFVARVEQHPRRKYDTHPQHGSPFHAPGKATHKAKYTGATAPILWNKLYAEARSRFGVQRLRPGQREVLEAVLSGRDVLALMPTGSGKSFCY